MSKGIWFWVIWVLAFLSFLGVIFMGWPTIYSGGVMLVLFGLLGWSEFGPVIK